MPSFLVHLIMEYQKLFSALWKSEIRYLLCGGFAVNIYGVPRMTADIDLDFHETNLDLFSKVLAELDYQPAIPLSLKILSSSHERTRLKEEKNLIAYSFNNRQTGYLALDVLLNPPIEFNEMWERREQRAGKDYQINLVSIEDLIRLKEYAGRVQDNDDIVLLNKFRKK